MNMVYPYPLPVTTPADLVVKDMTIGLFRYTFFRNTKIFDNKGLNFMGIDDDYIFKVHDESLEPYVGQFADTLTMAYTALGTKRDYVNGGNVATILNLSANNDNGVWIRMKYGPVNLGEDAGKVSLIDNPKMIQYFIEETARQAQADIQQFLINAVVAATSNMTSSAHTYSVYGSPTTGYPMSTSVLARARQKWGDKASFYLGNGKGAWIMNSIQEADLAASQVGGTGMFQIVKDVVTSGSPMTLGAPYISYDDQSTLIAGSSSTLNEYQAIGLGQGAARVHIKAPEFYANDQRLEYETVVNFLRADLDFMIEIPRFSFNKSAGGANPTLAAVATGGNWTPNYSDAREVASILVETNADADLTTHA
jgi:hypothetical protein